jgi:hypothetical protein
MHVYVRSSALSARHAQILCLDNRLLLDAEFYQRLRIVASRFSMELKPEFYFAVNGGRYPMGVHAWWTIQPKFWAPCIPPLAAIL